MDKDKTVVVSVIRKNTGLMHIDRYNEGSSVIQEALKELEGLGTTINKVTIETISSTYIIKWDE